MSYLWKTWIWIHCSKMSSWHWKPLTFVLSTFFKMPSLLKLSAKMHLDNYSTWEQRNRIFFPMILCLCKVCKLCLCFAWLGGYWITIWVYLGQCLFSVSWKAMAKRLPNWPQTGAYYQCYVDDIFVIFKSPEHLFHFCNHLNSKHPNKSFSLESESNNIMSLIDLEKMVDSKQLFTINLLLVVFTLFLIGFYQLHINIVWFPS